MREVIAGGTVVRVTYAVVLIPGKKHEDFVSTPTTTATTDDDAIVSFGVFDGHGGSEAARYSAQQLCARIVRESSAGALKGQPPADDCLRRAFEGTNDEVRRQHSAACTGSEARASARNAQVWGQRYHYSGTTAVCLFVTAPTADGVVNLTCASVGDSEAAAFIAPPEVVGEESCSCRTQRSAPRPVMTKVSTPHNASNHTEVLPSPTDCPDAHYQHIVPLRVSTRRTAASPRRARLRTRAQQARILRAAPGRLARARAAAAQPDAPPPPPADGDVSPEPRRRPAAGQGWGTASVGARTHLLRAARAPRVPVRRVAERREAVDADDTIDWRPRHDEARATATPGVRPLPASSAATRARCVLGTDGMWNQVSGRARPSIGVAAARRGWGATAGIRPLTTGHASEARKAHVATGQADLRNA